MDIVERLRDTSRRQETEDDVVNIIEAANEIELLCKERDGLRETIQKILDGIYIAKHYADEALKEKG